MSLIPIVVLTILNFLIYKGIHKYDDDDDGDDEDDDNYSSQFFHMQWKKPSSVIIIIASITFLRPRQKFSQSSTFSSAKESTFQHRHDCSRHNDNNFNKFGGKS